MPFKNTQLLQNQQIKATLTPKKFEKDLPKMGGLTAAKKKA